MSVGHPEPSLACDFPLGRPGLVTTNELVLTGWAVSPVGISGVAVQIGERQWNASYGLDRPSVGRKHPGLPRSDRAGYELRIDTSRWPAGQHYVTVAAFDVEGKRTAVEGAVQVLPSEPPPTTVEGRRAALAAGDVAIALDEPVARSGDADDSVEISGWAYAATGIEAVLVTVDGRHQHEALRPIVRPDLLRDYGPEVAAEAGFVTRLDATQAPPGQHALSVVAIGRDGHTASVEREITTPVDTGAVAVELAAPAAHETDRHWHERALLAEADAAVSRAECDLARAEQERTAWELRRLEARVSELSDSQ